MEEEFMLMNDTLDVEEFLCDVSMHLKRRDLRMLLTYIGMSKKDAENTLYENSSKTGTERGLLTSQGTIVEGSSSISFMDQRRKAMHIWWQYATNAKNQITDNKLDEEKLCELPQITEENQSQDRKNNILSPTKFPSISPHIPISRLSRMNGNPATENQNSTIDDVTVSNSNDRPNIPVLQLPMMEAESTSSNRSQPKQSSIYDDVTDKMTIDQAQQTDLIGGISPDQVAIFGSNVTLEGLLRKLWRCLHSCGLNKVVDQLQQRWMIRVDINQGRANMYPKMYFGTPLPPNTPFTYPPFKKIGHLAVVGSTMPIEEKPVEPGRENDVDNQTQRSNNLPNLPSLLNSSRNAGKTPNTPNTTRNDYKVRSAVSRGVSSVLLDGMNVTSFPARDTWKLKTDTFRRKGAAVKIHVTLDDVTLPAQPNSVWGSSLHVSPEQIRERVARVFFTYALRESRSLCRTVDRIERNYGLVIESAAMRIGGAGNGIEITSSELVFQCRCLYPSSVEQLWLLYQSGQLRENVQAGLVTKRAQQSCSFDHVHVRVEISEEEYRRALGLLRRKPMSNTKLGRFYLTGVTGGKNGRGGNQKHSLSFSTRYLKLPEPNNYETSPPVPPTSSMTNRTKNFPPNHRSRVPQRKPKISGSFMQKVLSKELDSLLQRMRLCEDDWFNFATDRLIDLLYCSRNVMKRRIMGATVNSHLTPRVTSLNVFHALYKAIKSTKTSNSMIPSPRNVKTAPNAQNNHTNIALLPSPVTFSNVDLVTSVNDDDDVVKERKQEERSFVVAYVRFSDMLAEMTSMRTALNDKIVTRLTTNPTVAPSQHLYLVKDIHNLMERWRLLLTKDFDLSHDESVLRFSSRMLANEEMSLLFGKENQEQFPGIFGLFPIMFHIADQVISKLKLLLQKPETPATTRIYTSLLPQGRPIMPPRQFSLWLSS